MSQGMQVLGVFQETLLLHARVGLRHRSAAEPSPSPGAVPWVLAWHCARLGHLLAPGGWEKQESLLEGKIQSYGLVQSPHHRAANLEMSSASGGPERGGDSKAGGGGVSPTNPPRSRTPKLCKAPGNLGSKLAFVSGMCWH